MMENIPPTITTKIQDRYDRDKEHIEKKQNKIKKDFYKIPLTDLRKLADLLYGDFLDKKVSYEYLAKKLNISIGKVRVLVGQLNLSKFYPLKLVPSGKSGEIQSSRKDLFQSEKALLRRERAIATLEQTRDNIEVSISDLITEAEKEERKKEKEKKIKKLLVN